MSKYLTKAERADAAEALLLEVAGAGVVLDDSRIGYVEIQIDRETWLAIRAAHKEAKLG